MSPFHQYLTRTRRDFLTTSACGLGGVALSHMLAENAHASTGASPLAPKPPHFAPKAKNCIFIFMAGAPSQLDLFDPKPKLNELHGKKMGSLTMVLP